MSDGTGSRTTGRTVGFDQTFRCFCDGGGEEEYLHYPKEDTSRPMSSTGVHYWFKRALKRAELPATMKPHELRHSAADNLWRQSGNLTLAQQLLSHGSPATTAGCLHPTREDLEAALEALEG